MVGEMSLVGPRPERPEFAQALAEEIPRYLDRLLVLPGVTGLAQVNLPPDTDFDSVRRKLLLDLRYIAGATVFLDLRLLAATVAPLIGIPSRWANRFFGLRCKADLGVQSEHSVERFERVEQLSEEHAAFLNSMSISR
jgi:hypothetical protein